MQCLFKTYWAIFASQQQKNRPNKCHTGFQLIPALLCAASSSSLLRRMNQQCALPAGTELIASVSKQSSSQK